MEKLDPKKDGATSDIIERNVEELQRLFPEIVTEGKIDFDVLQEVLGDYTDDREERYSFTWNGKSRARRLAQTPSTGTLRPCPEESVNWDTTQNLFIEGDNLEVLKLLQKSYHRKIKMIYIDPPYNTGGDFIYPDNFRGSISNYLELTGQTDGSGKKLTTNPETSGRYHSNWLSMMLPRLKLARNLLTDDGIIFISINDVECANLRSICDEVFGEENLFAQLPWQARTSVQSDTDISIQHEYVVGYARHRRREHRRLKESNQDIWHSLDSFAAFPNQVNPDRYGNPDNDPRGLWKADPFDAPNIRDNLTYAIRNPNTDEEHWPPQGRCWRTDPLRFEQLLRDGRIVFGKSGTSRPQLKVFYVEKKDFGEVPTSWLNGSAYGTATRGTQEMQALFAGTCPFPFPKPTDLVKALIRLATRDGALILDFFAGSCTTAHAVFAENAEDGGQRSFIMVQLPEPCSPDSEASKMGLETIAEIGKERIRRAGAAVQDEISRKRTRQRGGLFELDGETSLPDLGFRVLKLDSSNIKAWDAEFEDVEGALLSSVDNVKPERSESDVLYELLLKFGLDLAVPMETREIAGKTVHIIGAGALIVCLADEINIDVVEGIAALKQELAPETIRVVFKDAGFADDVVKTNAVQILHQAGIEDVRSL